MESDTPFRESNIVFRGEGRTFEKEKNFVVKLDEAVKKAKQNREWRHEYMTLLMRDQEKFEQGMEQGIEQGMKQGIEQGIKQGITEMIRRMYENGFTMEQISLCANKGMDEVRAIIEREKLVCVR